MILKWGFVQVTAKVREHPFWDSVLDGDVISGRNAKTVERQVVAVASSSSFQDIFLKNHCVTAAEVNIDDRIMSNA